MQADLANLVGSRICHDLISPIGAINNGVELLALTDGGTGAELALIKQSVESAAARIKFFRIAYGAATPVQTVARSEIRAILAALSDTGRISYEWTLDDDQSRQKVRCIFLLLQALETALPLGGAIGVGQSGHRIVLRASGRRIAFEQSLWDGLTMTQAEPCHTAAQVQFALLPGLLAEAGLSPRVSRTDDHVIVQL